MRGFDALVVLTASTSGGLPAGPWTTWYTTRCV